MLTVHIIAFDIPYPADYGGVIDVYYKIKWLNTLNVKVILHCYEYGRARASELETICEKVFYYPRSTNVFNQFSILPYTVKSRLSKPLIAQLINDNHPIILEVLHTCWLMDVPELKGRNFIYRHSNIEHDYYKGLAKAEKNILKKIYLYLESWRLKKFEVILRHSRVILAVNKEDVLYFNTHYPQQKTIYLPSFHANDKCNSQVGKGDYILFHGNLSVSENYQSVLWLIEHVFSKIEYKVVIAGKQPPAFIRTKILKHENIKLVENPNQVYMQDLIENAHVHCLHTHQGTGLKLKLLNVMFNGRFVVVNSNMLEGTTFLTDETLLVANTPEAYLRCLESILHQPFTPTHCTKRQFACEPYHNRIQTERLVEILSEKAPQNN